MNTSTIPGLTPEQCAEIAYFLQEYAESYEMELEHAGEGHGYSRETLAQVESLIRAVKGEAARAPAPVLRDDLPYRVDVQPYGAPEESNYFATRDEAEACYSDARDKLGDAWFGNQWVALVECRNGGEEELASDSDGWDGERDGDDAPMRWDNAYECPCGEAWTSRWSCQVDDDCPACGTTCSPSESTDLMEADNG